MLQGQKLLSLPSGWDRGVSAICCSMLKCVAVDCSVLQCVAVCGSGLQRVAVCLPCVGTLY